MKEYKVIPYTETNDYRCYHVLAKCEDDAKVIGYLLDSDNGKKYPYMSQYWSVWEVPHPKVYTEKDVDFIGFKRKQLENL